MISTSRAARNSSRSYCPASNSTVRLQRSMTCRPRRRDGGGREVVALAFRLARGAAYRRRAARKRWRLLERYEHVWLDQIDVGPIRFARVDAERLLAHRGAHAAAAHVAVIVDDLAPRAAQHDGVLLVEARALLDLVRRDRDAAEFDPGDRAPRLLGALEHRDPVEPGLLECLEEQILAECTGDAARPQLG